MKVLSIYIRQKTIVRQSYLFVYTFSPIFFSCFGEDKCLVVFALMVYLIFFSLSVWAKSTLKFSWFLVSILLIFLVSGRRSFNFSYLIPDFANFSCNFWKNNQINVYREILVLATLFYPSASDILDMLSTWRGEKSFISWI